MKQIAKCDEKTIIVQKIKEQLKLDNETKETYKGNAPLHQLDYTPNKRIVIQNTINVNNRKLFISTVNLGIDLSFDGSGMYYENMVFDKTPITVYENIDAAKENKNNMNELFMLCYANIEVAKNTHHLLIKLIECYKGDDRDITDIMNEITDLIYEE